MYKRITVEVVLRGERESRRQRQRQCRRRRLWEGGDKNIRASSLPSYIRQTVPYTLSCLPQLLRRGLITFYLWFIIFRLSQEKINGFFWRILFQRIYISFVRAICWKLSVLKQFRCFCLYKLPLPPSSLYCLSLRSIFVFFYLPLFPFSISFPSYRSLSLHIPII